MAAATAPQRALAALLTISPRISACLYRPRPRPSRLRLITARSSATPPAPRNAALAAAKQLTNAIKAADAPDTLLYALQTAGPDSNARHLTFALLRLARLPGGGASPAAVWIAERLLEATADEEWSDISCANVLEACHSLRLGRECPELLQRVEMELARPGRRPDAPTTVSIMSSMAKLGRSMDSSPFLKRLERALLKKGKANAGAAVRFSDFEEGRMWALAWALTELQCSPALADALLVYCHRRQEGGLGALDPRALTHVSRLAAKRGSTHRALPVAVAMSKAVTHPRWLGRRGPPPPGAAREAPTLLLNLARLVRRAGCGETLEGRVDGALDPGSWHSMARGVRHILEDGPQIRRAAETLQRSIVSLIPSMDAVQLSTTASALAYLQRPLPATTAAVAARAAELAPTMDPIGLSTVAWALAALRHDDEAFCERACAALHRALISPDSVAPAALVRCLVSMLYALAVLDHHQGPQAQRLLPELVTRLIPQLPDFSAADAPLLPLVGWALVIVKGPPGRVTPSTGHVMQALRAWRTAVASAGAALPPRQLGLVRHVEVALRIECPDLGSDLPQAYDDVFGALYESGRLSARAAREWAAQADTVVGPAAAEAAAEAASAATYSFSGGLVDSSDDEGEASDAAAPPPLSGKVGSSFQREVHTAACRLLLGWEYEYWEPALSYPLDSALPRHRVALEADGPTHFAANTLRPLGNTRLKRRLLRQLGWRVVNVAVHEWRAAGGEAAREDLLRSLLAAQGAAVEELLDAVAEDQRRRELEGVAEAVAAARLVAMKGVEALPPAPPTAEETAAAEAVAQRAQRLDIIKASQGKLSRLGVAKRAALRKTAVAAKSPAEGSSGDPTKKGNA